MVTRRSQTGSKHLGMKPTHQKNSAMPLSLQLNCQQNVVSRCNSCAIEAGCGPVRGQNESSTALNYDKNGINEGSTLVSKLKLV